VTAPMPASVAAHAALAARGKRPEHGEPLLDRAFAILTAFTAQRRSMNLTELSKYSGLPKSTTLRLGRKLIELGVLERAGNGDFVIGLRLWEIGHLAPGVQGLRAAAIPYMEDLNLITRQHVLLAVRDGDEALLMERLSARAATAVLYQIGGRLPLHSTGVGRVLLAYADPDFQQHYLSTTWQVEPEGRQISNLVLRRTLADVRRTGCATVVRLEPSPLVSVAAPIWDPAKVVAAALSIVVPTEGADAAFLAAMVRTAAQAISRDLRSSPGAGTGRSRTSETTRIN
jgi:DNA-binding IclR family transcriptional regulator